MPAPRVAVPLSVTEETTVLTVAPPTPAAAPYVAPASAPLSVSVSVSQPVAPVYAPQPTAVPHFVEPVSARAAMPVSVAAAPPLASVAASAFRDGAPPAHIHTTHTHTQQAIHTHANADTRNTETHTHAFSDPSADDEDPTKKEEVQILFRHSAVADIDDRPLNYRFISLTPAPTATSAPQPVQERKHRKYDVTAARLLRVRGGAARAGSAVGAEARTGA